LKDKVSTKTQPLIKTKTKTKTFAIPKTEDFTDTKTMFATDVLTATQTQTKTLTQTKPQVATETATQTKTQPLTETLVETKLQTKPQTQTETELLTKPQTKIKTKIITEEPTKPPIKLRMPDGTLKILNESQVKSIIAWKQGIMYKMIWSPYYDDNNKYNSRKPIKGVRYYTGIESATKSAIARGIPPELIEKNMGIVRISFITPRGSNKPQLKFKSRRLSNKKRNSPSISIMRY
jgi:hypothetical protein